MSDIHGLDSEILDFARTHMVEDILHGWPHVERVLHYAELINEEMKGNWQIIKYAALLHDIGHKEQTENHNYLGAGLAEIFLKSKEIDERLINHIKECIITHSRQFSQLPPRTIEAQVLYDADGMDLFGPIGLMRGLLSCGLRGKGFDCMIKKLQWRIGEKENFFSTTALRFVRNNSVIIENYLDQLENQLKIIDQKSSL
ncbi:MAG: HD domain-containing protein [Spirochaetales bacterium]|nr:HD domain-containing protein [Spirochaetales bacterium]